MVYTSLAAGTIEIKASWSQGDVFVHKPTSKLTLPPLSPSFLLQHSQMELNILSLAVRWCTLLTPLSLWFPYANKDQCLSSFTPDLVERNQWQDNIRAAISTEAERFQAEESGKMLWMCHTGCWNNQRRQDSPASTHTHTYGRRLLELARRRHWPHVAAC